MFSIINSNIVFDITSYPLSPERISDAESPSEVCTDEERMNPIVVGYHFGVVALFISSCLGLVSGSRGKGHRLPSSGTFSASISGYIVILTIGGIFVA